MKSASGGPSAKNGKRQICNLSFFVLRRLSCGEKGIRTPETLLMFTRFPGGPVQPLLHLSGKCPQKYALFPDSANRNGFFLLRGLRKGIASGPIAAIPRAGTCRRAVRSRSIGIPPQGPDRKNMPEYSVLVKDLLGDVVCNLRLPYPPYGHFMANSAFPRVKRPVSGICPDRGSHHVQPKPIVYVEFYKKNPLRRHRFLDGVVCCGVCCHLAGTCPEFRRGTP